MTGHRRFLVLCLSVASFAVPAVCAHSAETPLDYNRDIRPILSNNCFHCHGPDPSHREADLRLDLRTTEGDIHGAEAVIDAANPAESEIVHRITSDDADTRMPPADSGKTLTPEQVATLKKWIEQGAKYDKHWAFVTPVRPEIPTVKNKGWVRNPIDSFVLAGLEAEGLDPSPAASPRALLRRMSLDLIGLPPTLDEIDRFDRAGGASACTNEIERLLKSPHFGERWGRLWLDVARYADSDGFEKDKPRFVWMYRDWVINALNKDLPYNEFIIDQIAGDELPHATQDQRVATGFLRNSMINEEGGIDPEQFRMEAMYDRMDAIGKGMLGLTIQCAQCHTHKYDPVSHTEYYQLFAFLNNCHEANISAYTAEQQTEWQQTARIIREIETRLQASHPDWRERMNAWADSVRGNQPEWVVLKPELDTSGGQKTYVLEGGSILAAGYSPARETTQFAVDTKQKKVSAIRLELLNDPSLPGGGPGRSIFGTCALTEFQVTATPIGQRRKSLKAKIAKATADVNPSEQVLDPAFDDQSGKRRVTGPIEYAIDNDGATAWGIDIGPGRSNVPRKAVFTFENPVEAAQGIRLAFKLQQGHGGWNSDDNQSNNFGHYRLSVTSADKPTADPLPADVRAAVEKPADKRTEKDLARMFAYWRTTVPEWADENRRIEALWQSHPRGTTQLALAERTDYRPTHRLDRGNFLAPAEEVTPGTPAFLHSLVREDASQPRASRLDFARWLADRKSPTTARSIVNRIWQAYFGDGLVLTAEDFGTQGDPPSNQKLLDWLAVELMDNNWSLKHIHRLIVDSATYRQSSAVTPKLLERDPANRLLARGPRYRQDAEIVRDTALAASGLLNDAVGGPSVCPPAPTFLFQPPASYGPKTWNVSTGPDRYRRGLYTFRFRSVPYPVLQNFDAPIGEVACARRPRSNTPLQALTTLNEPLFIECARSLALKMLEKSDATDADRLSLAVKRCLSRDPRGDELKVLQSFLDKQRTRFTAPGADPWPLLADNDEAKQKLTATLKNVASPADLAAWTAVARVILNLDETITKE